jgi:hypothetical protein
MKPVSAMGSACTDSAETVPQRANIRVIVFRQFLLSGPGIGALTPNVKARLEEWY